MLPTKRSKFDRYLSISGMLKSMSMPVIFGAFTGPTRLTTNLKMAEPTCYLTPGFAGVTAGKIFEVSE